jgi:hypothetical protein
MSSRIGLARILIGLGILSTLVSLFETASHVQDSDYVIPSLADGPRHAQFHFLRETTGHLGILIAVALIMLQPGSRRTPTLWWVMLILLVGYYGGFWIGYPVIGVGGPNVPARIVHTTGTVLGLAGALVARRCFSSEPGGLAAPAAGDRRA